MKKKMSGEVDLEDLKKVIQAGKLESAIAKLDPDDISRSLREVPHPVIRLLIVCLGVPNAGQQIATLKPEQRDPLLTLIETSKKTKAVEFTKRLLVAAKEDPQLLKRLGLHMSDVMPIHPTEALAYNTITDVRSAPFMMLLSSRLYAQVVFLQQEKVLFTSTMELDELLQVALHLITAANCSAGEAQRLLASVTPTIAAMRCEQLMVAIDKQTKELRAALPKISRKPRNNKVPEQKRQKLD
jgi:hypothetical protein